MSAAAVEPAQAGSATTEEEQPLFDPNVYDDPRLKLTSKEGRSIDEIIVSFTGAITLNRRDPDDVQLWKSLSMGKEVEFTVNGKIAGDALAIKPPTERRRELLSGKRTVNVHTLTPADDDEQAGA